jgi:hypothetical protein
LNQNRYYDFVYDFALNGGKFQRLIAGPLLLGYLVNQADNFFYISKKGFLMYEIDQRDFEFDFLRKKNKKIACFFCGSDIRAPLLMLKFAKENDIELIANYFLWVNPKSFTMEYDNIIRNRARVAEKHASLIFTASTDQMSYFSRKTEPFIYFFPDNNFYKDEEKFNNVKRVKIVHAPSSPIIKGTQLVRAAIAKLKKEGYPIDYEELMGVSNETVLRELRSSHIVLNEFYALVPGLFGVEAMASYCALMTSADENLEKDLPPGSNNAWFVTRNFEVYDNLKTLLDNPTLMKKYAEAGYAWAWENASLTSSGRKLSALLKTMDDTDSSPRK